MGVDVCIQNRNPKGTQIAGDTAFAAGNATGQTNAVLCSLPAGWCTQASARDD